MLRRGHGSIAATKGDTKGTRTSRAETRDEPDQRAKTLAGEGQCECDARRMRLKHCPTPIVARDHSGGPPTGDRGSLHGSPVGLATC